MMTKVTKNILINKGILNDIHKKVFSKPLDQRKLFIEVNINLNNDNDQIYCQEIAKTQLPDEWVIKLTRHKNESSPVNQMINDLLDNSYPNQATDITLINSDKTLSEDALNFHIDSLWKVSNNTDSQLTLQGFLITKHHFKTIMTSFCHLDKIRFSMCKFTKEFDEDFKIHDKIKFNLKVFSLVLHNDLTYKQVNVMVKALSRNLSLKECLKSVKYITQENPVICAKFIQDIFDKNWFKASVWGNEENYASEDD